MIKIPIKANFRLQKLLKIRLKINFKKSMLHKKRYGCWLLIKIPINTSCLTYRKLLNIRSEMPNCPSASVSLHWACLKHTSALLAVVTPFSWEEALCRKRLAIIWVSLKQLIIIVNSSFIEFRCSLCSYIWKEWWRKKFTKYTYGGTETCFSGNNGKSGTDKCQRSY